MIHGKRSIDLIRCIPSQILKIEKENDERTAAWDNPINLNIQQISEDAEDELR